MVRHIREKGQTPQVDQVKIREVLEDFRDQRSGKAPKPRPWEDRIKERQTYVRKAWLTAAKDLAQSHDSDDQELAKCITAFVGSMPSMKTERHELQEKIVERLQRSAQACQGKLEGKAQVIKTNDRRVLVDNLSLQHNWERIPSTSYDLR